MLIRRFYYRTDIYVGQMVKPSNQQKIVLINP